jgi:predicted nucleic acid-binding protein
VPASIVADASPLIALSDGGFIDVLRLAFDEVVIPERVHREVFLSRYARVKPSWIKIRAITSPDTLYRYELFRNTYFLDGGESEAIALAEEIRVDVLLDERNARGICKELGVPHRSAYEVCAALVNDGKLKKKQFEAIKTALRFHGGFTPDREGNTEIA